MQVLVQLIEQECAQCGTHFAIAPQIQRKSKETGKSFYCPNGHSLWFGKSEVDKLKQRLRSEEAWSKTISESLETERRRHSATKGQLTKTKKRVANGVCPCCSRTFVNLHRHMEGQHPEYIKKETKS